LRRGHSPTHRKCYNESNNPHQFSILDFRFPIVGVKIGESNPKNVLHVFASPNRKSAI
jgi:hypothetical protein